MAAGLLIFVSWHVGKLFMNMRVHSNLPGASYATMVSEATTLTTSGVKLENIILFKSQGPLDNVTRVRSSVYPHTENGFKLVPLTTGLSRLKLKFLR